MRTFDLHLQDDIRDIAARTRELATHRLHTIPGFIFDLAVNRMVELTGRTTAVHAVIDAMTNSRPSASRYIKNVHHAGSDFLRPHEYAAIIQNSQEHGDTRTSNHRVMQPFGPHSGNNGRTQHFTVLPST